MTEQERGLIFLCSLLGPIPFVWFITAKFTYGINSETAHYLVPYLLKNTFNLWPLWAAIIAGVVIGLCGFIGFIITIREGYIKDHASNVSCVEPN